MARVLGLLGLFSFLAGCGSDSFVATEAGADASVEGGGEGGTCPDPHFCDDKCGTGLANGCGQSVDCRTDCGLGSFCDGNTHKCVCKTADGWCSGRCGSTTDNCNQPITCPMCANGVGCNNGTCGNCTPSSNDCNGKVCGPGMNNCGQAIVCGACVLPKTCSNGKCCEDQTTTCAGKCGLVANSCGQMFQCGCPLNQQCCNGVCANLSNDFNNCGACGASCAKITNSNMCELGGCTCSNHGLNTDPTGCGPCSMGSMNCTQAGRSKCTGGVCFF